MDRDPRTRDYGQTAIAQPRFVRVSFVQYGCRSDRVLSELWVKKEQSFGRLFRLLCQICNNFDETDYLDFIDMECCILSQLIVSFSRLSLKIVFIGFILSVIFKKIL